MISKQAVNLQSQSLSYFTMKIQSKQKIYENVCENNFHFTSFVSENQKNQDRKMTR
jgi:hypothetical protein